MYLCEIQPTHLYSTLSQPAGIISDFGCNIQPRITQKRTFEREVPSRYNYFSRSCFICPRPEPIQVRTICLFYATNIFLIFRAKSNCGALRAAALYKHQPLLPIRRQSSERRLMIMRSHLHMCHDHHQLY